MPSNERQTIFWKSMVVVPHAYACTNAAIRYTLYGQMSLDTFKFSEYPEKYLKKFFWNLENINNRVDVIFFSENLITREIRGPTTY